MIYDLIVIGGGPAGMMAAARAGELGARVLLLEKNNNLGVKLLMTAQGRCNLTNNIQDIRFLISKFGVPGKFLFSAFSSFGPKEVIAFFAERGVKTKVEEANRVLTANNSSQEVLQVLLDYLKQNQVQIKTLAKVKKIKIVAKKIEKVILENGEEIAAHNFIICTGGKSYPASGSTGDAYAWLKEMGHTIIKPVPALTPIIAQENFIKELEGLSFDSVLIDVYKNNLKNDDNINSKLSHLKNQENNQDYKKIDSILGPIIFTANGLSGPAILAISKSISRSLPEKVKIIIDFKPELNTTQLDQLLQKRFQEAGNKSIKNGLENLLPPRLILLILKLADINSDKKIALITKIERQKIIKLTKEFSLLVKEVLGYNRAMITSGGVFLKEVDSKTMNSKIIKNLYLAGELLDLDGPTGGFNLQLCWSTGRSAGESAALNLKKSNSD
jgi:hypothetical protein